MAIIDKDVLKQAMTALRKELRGAKGPVAVTVSDEAEGSPVEEAAESPAEEKAEEDGDVCPTCGHPMPPPAEEKDSGISDALAAISPKK